MENLKELRIGNYVEVNGEISKIEGVIKYGIYYAFGYCPNQDNWIKPIELTEEWLLKFGFRYYLKHIYLFPNNDSLRMWGNSWTAQQYLIGLDEFTDIPSPSIKYVHQLQNLYFALTSEELVIKD